MDKKIIDVSRYNGTINWSKVDCDGVIIRIAYRGYGSGKIVLDDKFIANIKGAIANGIPVGVYFMSQAINTTEAIEEAVYTVNTIKGYNVELPIFIDSEPSGASNNSGRADGLSKSTRTTICKAFCDKIVSLGYKAGTYASTSWFKSNLDVSQLLNYYVWDAQYASKCTATHRVDMWQYTSKGSINGISGNVDISHGYVDFDNTNSEPEVEVDDEYNKTQFIRDIQSAIGAIVDGIAGSETLSKTITVSRYTNIKHEVVLPIQKYLNLLGYNCGTEDGIAGTKFDIAVRNFQTDNGCIVDGVITRRATTWKKLLGLA